MRAAVSTVTVVLPELSGSETLALLGKYLYDKRRKGGCTYGKEIS